MSIIPDAKKDTKDMIVAGCRVQLAFHQENVEKWMVHGTVRCGIEEQAAERAFHTASYATRDEAEEAALKQATDLLGNNVDRNTSRVNNLDDRA
jgi:hypothetical protein